jgi:hypothetical protein
VRTSFDIRVDPAGGDRTMSYAAAAVAIGALLSGPVGLVTLIDPQPARI